MKKLLLTIAIAIMALTALAAEKAQSKSIVHLKSGEYVTGKILARNDVQVELVNDEGIKYVFLMDEVDYITHERKKKNYDISKFRGFVETGYSMGFGAPRADYWLVETSFGYMISPKVYIGAGAGIHKFNANKETFPISTFHINPDDARFAGLNLRELRFDSPELQELMNQDEKLRDQLLTDPELDHFPFYLLYADARYNMRSENFNTPWVGIRMGGSILNHVGWYIAPSIGYHFATSEFFSFNISAGYSLHTADYKRRCRGEEVGAILDKNGGAYQEMTGVFHNAFLKVGVEF